MLVTETEQGDASQSCGILSKEANKRVRLKLLKKPSSTSAEESGKTKTGIRVRKLLSQARDVGQQKRRKRKKKCLKEKKEKVKGAKVRHGGHAGRHTVRKR